MGVKRIFICDLCKQEILPDTGALQLEFPALRLRFGDDKMPPEIIIESVDLCEKCLPRATRLRMDNEGVLMLQPKCLEYLKEVDKDAMDNT